MQPQQPTPKNTATVKGQDVPVKPQRRADDTGGIYYSSVVKISDPTTGEVLVHIRGDQ